MNFKRVSLILLLSFVPLVYAESDVTVTVWVHGTYLALKVLAHKKSPFRSLVYVPTGFSLAKDLPSNYYFYKLGYGCHECDSINYNIDHFYLYGWHSSNIRPSQRKKIGQQLYQGLNELLKKYQKTYNKITLRLVGFSHGGNVILHCLSCLPFILDKVDLEVILMATPIQESTRNYINNPHITQAYSFYSQADWIQKIDIQKLHYDAPKHAPFWSQRIFLNADNVTQIHLKINGKDIGHGKFRSVVHYIPIMMKEVQKMKHKNRIDLDFEVK